MRLFVTGTDTGVGKSVVTACLAEAARARGTVVACKPVASGVDDGAGEDATLLGEAAGHPPLVYATFRAPVSPHRASREEGRVVPVSILGEIRRLQADTVLVEGVGGWRVPICLETGLWVEHLARATGGPVVVVAADRLGVLNHALLTVEAVRADGLEVAAVVLNGGAAPADASRASNRSDLAELLGLPVLAVPTIDPRDRAARAAVGADLLSAIVRP